MYVHVEVALTIYSTINITTSDRYWLTVMDNCDEVVNVRFGEDMTTACSLK